MKVIETGLEGLFVIEPKVFGDARGFFLETFNQAAFRDAGVPTNYVQDNWSRSRKGVLRGVHFQNPNPQGKLVRVVSGAVWDVAVDLRRSSKTFGRWYGTELSFENKRAMYVPEGFGHAFVTLADDTDFQYKCTRLYSPKDEIGLLWNDPDVGIKWPVEGPQLSEKDLKLPTLKDLVARGLTFP